MNIELELFIESIKTLARTIRIKHSSVADQINAQIVKIYGVTAVSYELPRTWKYYLNISGQYHTLDTVMTVTSWDTGEEIVFNQTNLETHAKTKEVYAYGTLPYKELVARYEDQEDLILGILYPCDINTAIAAEDGDVLSYPPSLVEDNEVNLITGIETWVKAFMRRHYNVQHAIAHELYTADVLGKMYLYLTMAIFNLRLEFSNTREAHSFHIRQYLKSRGLDGEALRFLSTKQLLYFYRNINYIQRNPGTTVMLKELIEAIMSERNLPVSEYSMRHTDETQLVDLYSTPVFKKRLISSVGTQSAQGTVSLDAILEKESVDTVGNPQFIIDEKERIRQDFQHSRSNVVQTKVLESTMTVYGDVGQFSLANTLLMYWAYMAKMRLYTNIVRVQNPKSGEYFSIAILDALAIALYLTAKSEGYEMRLVPHFIAEYVPRIPTPPLSDLLSVVNPDYVDTTIIAEARALQPNITAFSSTIDFANKVQVYHSIIQKQNNMKYLPGHMLGRAMAECAISRLYHDSVVFFAPAGTTYDAFFASRGFDFSDYTDTEYKLLYNSIVREATGIDENTGTTLQNMHKAMVRLLKYLSSYSIQVLRDYSGSEIYDLRTDMMHLGYARYLFKDKVEIPLVPVKPWRERSKLHSRARLNIARSDDLIGGEFTMHDKDRIDAYAGLIGATQTTVERARIQIPTTMPIQRTYRSSTGEP